ncbi:TetR/AcrR family transcriptional regulator [Kribbella sp. NBC_01505]|uniref:TetR/AcrR family transcriptional regulator n=1 Tax=Kribbella sp. NBC_01505 TaxID=2903580 RepID=UPI003864D0DD
MAETHRAQLPRGAELAWATAREPKRGPRPGLNLGQIVHAAIGLADRSGLAAVSLARVAAELGCATTSLYRYVRAKEDLVLLMRDTAAAPPPDLHRPDPDRWEQSLRRLAEQIFARYRAHPWMLDTPPTGPPTTPNELMWGEHMLRAMSRTTLSAPDRLRAITLITGYVREQARLAADPVIAGEAESGYVQLLSGVLTPDRYPMFCQLFADETITSSIAYTDQDFQFGLDRIMTGLTDLAKRSA